MKSRIHNPNTFINNNYNNTSMVDLRINYSILDDILETLGTYQRALSDMEEAIDTATTTILQSKGKGIHAIQNLSDTTKNGLSTYNEQLGDLIRIISGFIFDMTDYIMPESRAEEMRVNRDNIKWSIGKIEDKINKYVGKMNSALSKTPGTIRVTEDMASALQRNHSKLSVLHYEVSAFATGMNNIIIDFWDLYNYKVNPYQECDEDFAQRVKVLYDSYSSWWEKFCDFWMSVGSDVADFFVGLLSGLVELIVGLFKLVYGLFKLAAAEIVIGVWLLTNDIPNAPDWAIETIMNIGLSFDAIINDPSLIWEGLNHSISEAWDNKGAAYCIGYAIGLILPIIVTSGIGAFGEGAGETAVIAGLLEEGNATELLTLVRAGVISFRQIVLVMPFEDLIYVVSFTEIIAYVPIEEILLCIRFMELAAIVPITEIVNAVSVTELIAAGVTVTELLNAGVVVADFARAGFTVEDIATMINEILGVTWPETGPYTEAQIQTILEVLRGSGFADNPLRLAYEQEVRNLATVGERMLAEGCSEEIIARTLYQRRHDLTVQYKEMTPQPLRDYIYYENTKRYGDPIGPTFEQLLEDKTFLEIIKSSSKPNTDIDSLLSNFENWLRRQ